MGNEKANICIWERREEEREVGQKKIFEENWLGNFQNLQNNRFKKPYITQTG